MSAQFLHRVEQMTNNATYGMSATLIPVAEPEDPYPSNGMVVLGALTDAEVEFFEANIGQHVLLTVESAPAPEHTHEEPGSE